MENNRAIGTLLTNTAQNLIEASEGIKLVTRMQKDQIEWFQCQVSENNRFWQKVVWRTIVIGGVIVLAAFGLSRIIPGGWLS